jgi:hypothetical protein
MFIKIPKGSELYDKCNEIMDRMVEYDKASFEWAKSQGATSIRGGWFDIAGGISTAEFPNKPPKGWVKAGHKFGDNEYSPGKSAAGKDIQKAINGLKKMTFDEFNKAFSFDPSKHIGNKRSWHPAFLWREDYVLMVFADHTPYTLMPGMEEITVTEYNKLSEKS